MLSVLKLRRTHVLEKRNWCIIVLLFELKDFTYLQLEYAAATTLWLQRFKLRQLVVFRVIDSLRRKRVWSIEESRSFKGWVNNHLHLLRSIVKEDHLELIKGKLIPPPHVVDCNRLLYLIFCDFEAAKSSEGFTEVFDADVVGIIDIEGLKECPKNLISKHLLAR